MSFSIITVRTYDDEDDALFPRLDSMTGGPAFDADDGSLRELNARELEIYEFNGGVDRVLSLDSLTFEVAITDSRVVVWCKKFDKGGGWRGFGVTSLVIAGAANAVSHARAASRRKGKCLVGQVRYPWLAKVGYRSKQGMFSSVEEIRLLVEDGTSGSDRRRMALDLRLNSTESARSVAETIVRRAVDYRLARAPDLEPEERQSLEELQRDGVPRARGSDDFTMVHLAGGWVVRSKTARYPKTPDSETTVADPGAPAGEIGDVQEAESDDGEGPAASESVEPPESAGVEQDGAVFCHRCGRPFVEPEVFCPDCGSERRTRPTAATIDEDSEHPEATAPEVESGSDHSDGTEATTGETLPDEIPIRPIDEPATDDLKTPAVGDPANDTTGGVDDAGFATIADVSSLGGEPSGGVETFPCPSCACELPLIARFCAKCGEAITPQEEPGEPDPDATVRRPRRQ